jgi:hypothetical protein
MNSEMGGDHQVAGVKDPFDDSERPFDQRSDSADSVISQVKTDPINKEYCYFSIE